MSEAGWVFSATLQSAAWEGLAYQALSSLAANPRRAETRPILVVRIDSVWPAQEPEITLLRSFLHMKCSERLCLRPRVGDFLISKKGPADTARVR